MSRNAPSQSTQPPTPKFGKNDAAAMRVAEFCKTLYGNTPEPSSFYKDERRNHPRMGEKKLAEHIAAQPAETLDRLIGKETAGFINLLNQELTTLQKKIDKKKALGNPIEGDEASKKILLDAIETLNSWSTKTREEKATAINTLLEQDIAASSQTLREQCARSWIAENLALDQNDPKIGQMIQCSNQILRDSANFTSNEVTQQFGNALSMLNGKQGAIPGQETYTKNDKGEIVLTIEIQPTLASFTLNRDCPLEKITYEYTLNSADPPSFVLTNFTCPNKNYEALLNPSLTEQDRNNAAFTLLHHLATTGAPIPDKNKTAEERKDGVEKWLEVCDDLNVPRSLKGFDLSGLDLSGMDLSGCDLSGADLSGADLSCAEMQGCILCGTNLTGAILTGANLTEMTINTETNFSKIIDRNAYIAPTPEGYQHFRQADLIPTTCPSFKFQTEDGTTIDHTTKDFLTQFKSKYDPPRSLTFLSSPKDTEITRLLAKTDATDGFKLFKLLSHAEEKTTFGRQNSTSLALEATLPDSKKTSLASPSF